MNNKYLLSIYIISILICLLLIWLDIESIDYKNNIIIIMILLQNIPLYIIYNNKWNKSADGGNFNKCSSLIESNIEPYDELCSNGKIDKKISLEIHPDKNPGCKDKATKFFQDVGNFCSNNIIKKYQPPENTTEVSTKANTYTTTNQDDTYQQYKPDNTYQQYKPDYINISDYDLKQKAQSGDINAQREIANRQPVRNIRLNPNERTDTDFCTIM